MEPCVRVGNQKSILPDLSLCGAGSAVQWERRLSTCTARREGQERKVQILPFKRWTEVVSEERFDYIRGTFVEQKATHTLSNHSHQTF